VLIVLQEVENCKDQWEIIMLDVTEVKEIVDGYNKHFENRPESELPITVRNAFTKFEKYVFQLSSYSAF
jgi:hypothetical protein